jgi:hypothetical protein
MENLPVELITEIFESIYFSPSIDGSDGPDLKTLSSCSIVCKFWSDPAQKILFRFPRTLVRSKHPFHHLRNIFTNSTRGMILGQYVRSIHILISPTNDDPGRAYSEQEFVQILSLFPRLYHLSVNTFPFNAEWDMDELAGLGVSLSSHIQQLSSLQLHNHAPRSTLLYFFLSIWPSIRFLKLSQSEWNDVSPPVDRPNFNLYQLSCLSLPSDELFRWLVPTNERHTLRILEHGRSQGLTQLTELLSREGEFLRSLTVEALDLRTVSLLELCPNLEELIIDYVGKEAEEAVVQSLPRNVQHLWIKNHTRFQDDSACKMVQKLTKLTAVTLPVQVKRMQDDPLAVEAICKERGLEIAYALSFSSWAWVRIYFCSPCSIFPIR